MTETKDSLTQELEFFTNHRAIVKKCNDFYEGGNAVTDGNYLYKFVTESNDVFNLRKARAFYDNNILAPVETLKNFIFANNNVERIAGSFMGGEIDGMFNNMDGLGADVNTFFKEVLKNKFTDGIFLILAEPAISLQSEDENKSDGKEIVLTQQDVVNNPPVFRIIRFENIMDYTADNSGLTSLKYNITVNERESVSDLIKDSNHKYFYIWKKSGTSIVWEKYLEKDEELVASETIPNMPVLPFTICYGIKKAFMEGLPIVQDMVSISDAIFNLDSKRINFLNFASTARLLIETSNEDDAKNMKFNDNVVTIYPPQSAAPSWMTCDQAPYMSMIGEREFLSQMAYRLFKLRLSQGTGTELAASGLSKVQDFKATEAELAALAEDLERIENSCYLHAWLWINNGNYTIAEDSRPAASYRKKFTVKEIEELMAELETFQTNDKIPQTLKKEVMRAFIINLPIWDKLENDVKKLIEDELEEIYKEPEQAEIDKVGSIMEKLNFGENGNNTNESNDISAKKESDMLKIEERKITEKEKANV